MQRDHPAETVSAVEIGQLAEVTRAAVANWMSRYDDFPNPIDESESRQRYDRAQVVAWMLRNGKVPDRFPATAAVWQALGSFTGDRPLDQTVGYLAWATAAFMTQRLDQIADPGAAALDFVLDMSFDTSQARFEELTPEEFGSLRKAALLLADCSSAPIEIADALFNLLSDPRKSDTFGDPAELQDLVAWLAAADAGSWIYDPAAGSGRLLARAAGGLAGVRLFGQEIESRASALAQAVAAIVGLRAAIATGDTIADDAMPHLVADRIVCSPPTEATVDSETRDDERWRYAPPGPDPFWAFAQHSIHHLAPTGRAVFYGPSSVAESGARSRKALLQAGAVDAVIALPRRWPAGSNTAGLVVLFRKPASGARDVLMVDLQDLIDDQHASIDAIKSVLEPLLVLRETQPGKCRLVSEQELADTKFDLTPSAYLVDKTDLPDPRPLLSPRLASAFEEAKRACADRALTKGDEDELVALLHSVADAKRARV